MGSPSSLVIAYGTKKALWNAVYPFCVIIFVPLVCGILCGPKMIIGVLIGTLINGASMSLSQINTGSAW
jgi:Na+/H+-translocating membrane pyrophosphatase